MDLLRADRYQTAMDKFKAIFDNPAADKPMKERALRRIADCRHYMSLSGNNQELLKAIDLYKDLLKEYPGSRDENAVSLYRLGKSYEGLKFYYEARKEYERLAGEFPKSSNAPEALFKAGEM